MCRFGTPGKLIAAIIILSCLTIITETHDCPNNWMDCGNGRCIAKYWHCDGENDCGNMKDEENCDRRNITCSRDQFRCEDNNCIPKRWTCDGEHDCLDESDEKFCSNSTTCDGFMCDDHVCIPERWRCDGQEDCKDRSDEVLCPTNSTLPCENTEFACLSGTCLNSSLLCNSQNDCADGSDEGQFCDSCKSGKCEHECLPMPSGALCSCYLGYQLNANNFSCDDIDECKVDGFCSHKCVNLRGSYKCSCIDGYELKDNRTCLAKGEEPLLVFATLEDIRAIYLRSEVYFRIHKAVSRSTAVDVDPQDSRVYWTDLSRQGSVIYSSHLDGTGFRAVIKNGLLVPEDIALDSVARNIYLTDSGLKQVMVCKMDGSLCHALHSEGVQKPRAIALDPAMGMMYWSDWGDVPGIHQSGMDGQKRNALVSSDIKWPNGITVDHTSNRLYWCDALLYRFEYITLDGRIRKVLLQDAVFHPYSLTVFEDRLYWTDWATFTLSSCNKFTGHDQRFIARENNKHIMGVHVYHPSSLSVSNPCWMSLCSHLCVISLLGKYKCLCPPGFSLNSDQTTCSIDGISPHIFVTEESNIYHIQPDAVGNDIIAELPSSASLVGDTAYNYNKRILYISDISKQLILQLNISTMDEKELVNKHVQAVESLAYDGQGDNLYWVDSSKGTVEVLALNTRARAVIIANLSKPLSIAVDSSRSVMFVSSIGGKQPNVAMYNMDGSNRIEFANLAGFPVSLAVLPKLHRIYVADPKSGTISSMDYTKPNSSAIVHKYQTPHITSVAVSEKCLYWMASSVNKLYLLPGSNRTNVHTLSIPGNVTSTAIRKVNYVEAIPENPSSCFSHNGGCSHICLPRPNGHTCVCPVEMQLLHNNLTCSAVACKASEFKCGDSACVPFDYRCDGVPDCKDKSDEEKCVVKRCPGTDFKCRNGRCIIASWKCDFRDDCGDNSDEEGCQKPAGCAKDKFSCQDGQCIPFLWHCDGEKDCNNSSDEENCNSTRCNENQLRCDHGQCIPLSWVCDGTSDCFDGTDERKGTCGISKANCQSSEFRCNDGTCIDRLLACDHRNDCADNSDEKNCSYNNKTCKANMFRCSDGTCIYEHEVCDGYEDCSNDETPANCTKTECSATEFYCSHTKRCIPRAWLCDGDNDCSDGADEQLQLCHRSTTQFSTSKDPKQSCNQFICESGDCLPWSKVCNGMPECPDYSDEGNLCLTSCGKANGGCSHLCSPSPQGSRCSCLAGFTLLQDKMSCADENECLQLGLCSQYCNNTKGGFKCSCAEGYFLAHDKRKCKADGGAATLVYLLTDQIRGLDLNSHTKRVYMQQQQTDMRGLDYDITDGVFFWTEWREGTISSYNIGSKRTDIMINDLRRPYFLRWDWIAKNIYYTNGEGIISACTRNGKYCTRVLDSGSSHINSFDISPKKGFMFWTIWSEIRRESSGLVERANMDGTMKIILVSDKVYWPTSVTVDHILESIYWTDVKLNILETCDYHGIDRKVVVSQGMYYPFSMAVFEDDVFWADWGTDTIFRCNKFTGEGCVQLHKNDVKAEILIVVHKVGQPKGINPCLNSPCTQLCLQKPDGFSCHCSDNYEFRNNSCIPERKTTKKPLSTYEPLVDKCHADYCSNGGICKIIGLETVCWCLDIYRGERCEILVNVTLAYDYGWLVATLLAIFAVSAIIMVIILCRQNRSKISKFGDTMAVSFRNPQYAFRKGNGLVMDTDDGASPEDLVIDRKPHTHRGFNNPLYEQRPYLDPAVDGDERWPTYSSKESVDNEYQTMDVTALTAEPALFSKEQLVQFFKRI